MADIICIVIVMIFLIGLFWVIYHKNSTAIGDKGRRNAKVEAVIYIILGVLIMLACILAVIAGYKSAIVYCIFFSFISLIFILCGIIVFVKLSKECEELLKVTHLTQCHIERMYSRLTSDYHLSGVSLDGNKYTFAFGGKDKHLMKAYKDQGRDSFEIIYYKHNGRIKEIH